MSARALIVLLLVLAAAAFAVFKLDRPKPTEGGAGEETLVPGFREGDVRSVVWGPASAPARLERGESEGWRLVAPVRAEADPREVDALFGAIARAKAARRVEPANGDLAAYGLGPDAPILEIVSAGGTVGLRLGRKSPVGPERYVAKEGRVLLVDGSTVAAFERAPESFRERRLIPLEGERMRRIEIDKAGERLAVERTGSTWSLVEPKRDAADDTACDALTRAIARLEVSDENPSSAEAAGRALEVGALRIRVFAEPGGPIHEARIALRGADGRRAAAREPTGPSGFLPESILEDVDRPPAALRDKRATPVGYATLRAVAFRAADGSGFELKRAGENAAWTPAGAESPAIDPSKLDAFLDRATHLRGIDLDRCRPPQAADALVFETANGESGRVSWGRDPDGTICLSSSWRPGVLFTMEDEAIRALPRRLADLAPDAPAAPAAP